MKRTIKLITVILLLAVVLIPVSASAESDKYTNADAYFDSTEGCIHTAVMVFISETGIYSVSILQHDICQDIHLVEAYGNKMLSKSEVKFIGNLKSATLHTTVPMLDDVRHLSFDAVLDLTWTGTGDLRVYGKEKYRDAVASGTVLYGTTNCTPDPSTQAVLYSAK